MRNSGTPAITHFDLEIPGGQTVALVGRSGAGKSTVINLVPRLFDVTTGRILIDGQDLREVTLASLRGAIAIVSQEVTLFDDTIAANIALGRLGARPEEIVAAARAAAAHEFILAQRDGYATEIGDRGLRLSGGQRQRSARAPSSRTRPSCCLTRRRAHSTLNRAARAGGARRLHAQPHDARHRPPPLDGAERRPHLRYGRGPYRGTGHARRPDGRDGPTRGSCARR